MPRDLQTLQSHPAKIKVVHKSSTVQNMFKGDQILSVSLFFFLQGVKRKEPSVIDMLKKKVKKK